MSWSGRCLLVNHMGHTVGDEDVSNNHLGVVDEDAAVTAHSDRHGRSLESSDGAVGQGRAVSHGASDNVVLQDGRKLLHGQSRDKVGDSLEAGVRGSKDGNVLSFSVNIKQSRCVYTICKFEVGVTNLGAVNGRH